MGDEKVLLLLQIEVAQLLCVLLNHHPNASVSSQAGFPKRPVPK